MSDDAGRRKDANQLRDIIVAILVRAGSDRQRAAVQADVLVEAELRGHPSHGLRRVPVLVGRLQRGLLISGAEPEFEWSTPNVLRVDGRGGFGPVVGFAAAELIASRARETGVAVAAIRRAHHLGMLAPYVECIVAAGCAAIVFTTSEALVHPWNGARALVGTNPIGIGIPTTDEPVILDMSTGATSAGRVRDYAARGQELPEGWAVDAEGVPTTDAAAAVQGAISPFGGPKGYALGVAFEILVGSLTATAFGEAVRGTLDIDHDVTKGDVMIALHLDAFGGVGSTALREYIDVLRASGASGGVVDVPGDRSRRTRMRSLEEGVDVDPEMWSTLLALAEERAP